MLKTVTQSGALVIVQVLILEVELLCPLRAEWMGEVVVQALQMNMVIYCFMQVLCIHILMYLNIPHLFLIQIILLCKNGDSIFGKGWYQELIIVPSPANDSTYYLFSIGVSGGDFGLKYSIIDMHERGLGAVTVKIFNFKACYG
ncbi:MAG: hypothetical protein IPP71_23855 [Bacteroidetes bacterium]|nr:hypothetical protein [Bacteroidota bacterium]